MFYRQNCMFSLSALVRANPTRPNSLQSRILIVDICITGCHHSLTQWPLRDVYVIFNVKFFKHISVMHFLLTCLHVNATRPHWWVNIGSGDGSRHQAKSHNPNQCWQSSVMLYAIQTTEWMSKYISVIRQYPEADMIMSVHVSFDNLITMGIFQCSNLPSTMLCNGPCHVFIWCDVQFI